MSENLTLALSIKTKMEGAVKDIKALDKGLQQNSKSAEQLNKTSRKAGNALDSLGGKASQANQALGKTREGVQSVSRQLAGLEFPRCRFKRACSNSRQFYQY